MIVWRDGEFVPAHSAISADDRGWLIGDAIFETFLVERGAAAFLPQHLARLRCGAAVMNLEAPVDEQSLRKAIADLAGRGAVEGPSACRLTLSRVGGPRGLAPSEETRTRMVLQISPVGPPPQRFRIMIAGSRRWSGAVTNQFKCVGAYAQNMLARREASLAGADEAIMLNEHGRIARASAANIFVFTEAGVMTPPLAEGAMPGIVRGILLEEAGRLGIAASEAPIDQGTLRTARILLTNSIVGVVRSALDGAAATAGEETARAMIAAYNDRLAAEFR